MNEKTSSATTGLRPTKNISFSLISSIARKAFKVKYPKALQFIFDFELIIGLDDDDLDHFCNEARIEMITRDDYHKLTKQKFFANGSFYENIILGLNQKVDVHGDLRKSENKAQALKLVKNAKFDDIVISKSQYNKMIKLTNQMKEVNPLLYILGETIEFNDFAGDINPRIIKKESCEMTLESGLKLKAKLDCRYSNKSGLSAIVDVKTGWKEAGGSIRNNLLRDGYNYQIALASYIMKQSSYKMSNVNYILYQNILDPIVNLVEFPFTNLFVSEIAVMVKRIEGSILRNIDLSS